MKLTYNTLALHELGVLQSLGRSTARESADTQREHVTEKFRLAVFEPNFADNHRTVELVREAFRTQHAIARWESDAGEVWLDQPVTIASDEEPEGDRAPLAGGTRQSLIFSLTYWRLDVDASALTTTYQPEHGDALNLGQVVKFQSHYTTEHFSPHRDHRRHTAGTALLKGRIAGDSSTPLAVQRATLDAHLAALRTALRKDASGRLRHGAPLDETVRVVDFTAEIDQEDDAAIEWTLQVRYTEFPNATDYAVCEVTLAPHHDPLSGKVTLEFSGRIGAPTAELCRAKLARLRHLIPSGHVCRDHGDTESVVALESGREAGPDTGDGQTAIEINFRETWQKAAGNVLESSLRQADADDVKSGMLRTTCAGTVLASGATADEAYTTAAAAAQTLGGGKYPMLTASSIERTDPQNLTSGPAVPGYSYLSPVVIGALQGDGSVTLTFNADARSTCAIERSDNGTTWAPIGAAAGDADGVATYRDADAGAHPTRTYRARRSAAQPGAPVHLCTVSFTFEYLRKGARIYFELKAEQNREVFGTDTLAVNGVIAAATYAEALAVYQTSVLGLSDWATLLLTNERRPTRAEQTIVSAGTLFDRFDFSFTLHLPKAAGATALAYKLVPQSNWQTLEKTTTVSGQVFASSEAAAGAFLDAFLATLSLGKRVSSERPVSYRQGNTPSGTKPAVFLAMEFSETFVDVLTGASGIRECEVTESLVGSADNHVVKLIPTGQPIIQKVGSTPGTRTVSGRVSATTEAACDAWSAKCRTLLTRVYEQPAQIGTTFAFLPQTNGTARGTGANVKIYTQNFTFTELLVSLPM